MVMGQWIATAVFATAALVLPLEAGAGFQTGDDLLEHCRDISDSGYGLCLGYVEGVADSTEATRLARHLAPCIHQEIGAAQLHNAVIEYLRDHPETRGQNASLLVARAVSSTWQCSATGP